MGLKYTKDYTLIIDELTKTLRDFKGVHEIFQMDLTDWEILSKDDRTETLNTLSDDIFYALGSESEYLVGNQRIKYNKDNNCLDIFVNQQLVNSISLYV